MRDDDLADDEKAEADALRSGSRRMHAFELLEQPGSIAIGDRVAFIDDVDPDHGVSPRQSNTYVCTRTTVVNGIRHEIAEHLRKSRAVPLAECLDIDVEADAGPGVALLHLFDHLSRESGEINRLGSHRETRPGPNARQVEQIGDHPLHALGATKHSRGGALLVALGVPQPDEVADEFCEAMRLEGLVRRRERWRCDGHTSTCYRLT
jgi:hypothetical protein